MSASIVDLLLPYLHVLYYLSGIRCLLCKLNQLKDSTDNGINIVYEYNMDSVRRRVAAAFIECHEFDVTEFDVTKFDVF
jgi:hypothetical protein